MHNMNPSYPRLIPEQMQLFLSHPYTCLASLKPANPDHVSFPASDWTWALLQAQG
jgi:hypothetical protein